MSHVSMQETIGASAAEVWKTISDFNGAGTYIGGIANSTMEGEGVGAVRTITMKNGGQVRERLESFDPQTCTLSYAIIGGVIPLENYLSTMEVKDLGDGQSTLAWSSTFEPKGVSEEEAKTLVEGIYNAGFKGLKRLYGG